MIKLLNKWTDYVFFGIIGIAWGLFLLFGVKYLFQLMVTYLF